MQNQHETQSGASKKRSLGCLSIIGLMLLTVVLTIGGTLWAINSQWFTKDFKPVELSEVEEKELSAKLNAIGSFNATPETDKLESSTIFITNDEQATPARNTENETGNAIQPEIYTEDHGKRRIELTERELNAMLAKNTDLAEQVVIDLSNNMASIKLLVDLDPDLPFLGGKTLKVSSGTELSYARDRPVVVMKGVSVWGVPIPNPWLGGLKNVDLVSEFGAADGFWKSFADGIEDIRVEDGKLLIQLAE